jgi:hypothetical protein
LRYISSRSSFDHTGFKTSHIDEVEANLLQNFIRGLERELYLRVACAKRQRCRRSSLLGGGGLLDSRLVSVRVG